MARRVGAEPHRARDAAHGVVEREVQLGLEVLAALRRVRAAPAAPAAGTRAEQVAEEVAQAAARVEVDVELVAARTTEASAAVAGAATRTETAGTDAGRDHAPDLVVLLALLGVTQHVVGGRDLLEAVFGVFVPRVRVGVVLLRQLPVRARDVFLGRALGHTEYVVVVLLEPLALRSHRITPCG